MFLGGFVPETRNPEGFYDTPFQRVPSIPPQQSPEGWIRTSTPEVSDGLPWHPANLRPAHMGAHPQPPTVSVAGGYPGLPGHPSPLPSPSMPTDLSMQQPQDIKPAIPAAALAGYTGAHGMYILSGLISASGDSFFFSFFNYSLLL